MREIIWLTNYNNKLECKKFVHLDFAPKQGIPESRFPQAVRITTKDNSAPPKECFLVDMYRIKMKNVVDFFTLLSHDKPAKEFIEEKMNADKRINWETEMAVYMYSESKTFE